MGGMGEWDLCGMGVWGLDEAVLWRYCNCMLAVCWCVEYAVGNKLNQTGADWAMLESWTTSEELSTGSTNRLDWVLKPTASDDCTAQYQSSWQ